MAHLALSLLGSFEATLDGALITTFESAKVRALLAYLAAETDRSHRREVLATLMWPDWPQQSAMSNLRYALADLRKNIGDREAQPPFLLITRESLQLNHEADVWVDILEYEDLTGLADLSGLKRAMELYRGEFLEGFSLPDSPAFEQWVLARREGLQRQALQALFTLVEAHEQKGELEAALPYARRQVELEPWHEPGQQQLMRLLALSGQRSAALAQYETCRQALADELNVEPSTETKRLYEAIRYENLQGIRERGAGISLIPSLLSRVPLPPEPGEAPFKGLQYFDVADADLFFGREALTARLVGHIREMVAAGADNPEGCCFLAVVGASGSGKSSVVRAGVVPALMSGRLLADGSQPPEGSPGWHIHVFTPTIHPLEALAVSLTREVESVTAATTLVDDMNRDTRSLNMYAQRLLAPQKPGLAGKCRLLLVVDQFEELFTLCRSETERTVFLDNLLKAVAGGGPTQVVVVLRADFYGHCAQYPLLRQALCSRQEYIGPMEASELRRAIEEPAQKNDWEFEPGLVDLLLRDTGVSEGHPPEPGALPLLEHALLETWKRRSGRTLIHQGYVDAGGVHGAIAKTAENVFASLSVDQQALARRIFLRLTELGEGTQDTRRRAPLNELSPRNEDTLQVNNLLKELADARLITLSENTAEVAHEALIREWPALRQWLSEDRDGLRLHRHLTDSAEAWAELDRDASELYRGARLAQATEWADGHPDDLNALEREYLQASQTQAERDEAEREAQRQRELQAAQRLARTQRQRSLVLSVGLAIAVVLIGVALWLNSRANANLGLANEQSRLSRSRELAAAAVNNLSKDTQLSVLLALEAVNTQYTLEAESALHQAVQADHIEALFSGAPGSVTNLAYSFDGSLLAAVNDQRWLQVFDTAQGNRVYTQQYDEDLRQLSFGPDGDLAVVGESFFTILQPTSGQEVLHGKTDITSTVRVWDQITNQEILVVNREAQSQYLTGGIWVSFIGQGLYLATYDQVENSVYSEISVWNLSTRQRVQAVRWKHGADVAASPKVIAFTSDGNNLVIPYDYGAIEIWDLASGNLLHKLTGMPPGAVNAMAFSPDGSLLAASGAYNTVKVWKFQAEELLLSLNGSAPLFSPSGEQLILTNANREVEVWSIDSQRVLYHFLCHPYQTASILSPDGDHLVAGGAGGTIHQCAVSPDYELRVWVSDFPAKGMGFSPTESLIGVASADNIVRLYDPETGELRRSVKLPAASSITAFTLSLDGTRFATADTNHQYFNNDQEYAWRMWDTATGQELVHNWAFGNITLIELSPDGNRLFYMSNDEILSAEIDSVSLGELSNYWIDWVAFTAFAYRPDGTRLALAKVDRRLGVFESPSEALVFTTTLESEPSGLTFNPDGSRLAIGTRQGEVLILEANTGKQLMTLPGQYAAVNALAYNPGGEQLATGSADGAVRLWDAASGKEILPLTRHAAAITFLAYSEDGSHLVSGSEDGVVRVSVIGLDEIIQLAHQRMRREFSPQELQNYHIVSPEAARNITPLPAPTRTPRPTATIMLAPTPTLLPQPVPQPHSAITSSNASQVVELTQVWTGFANDLAWAPDGKTLAVVTTLGLSVLDAHNLQEIWHQKNASLMLKVAFSPDGSFIATGGDDGLVRLWRAGDGVELTTLTGHTRGITALAFAKDGSWLASGSYDDTVRIWSLPDGTPVTTLVNETYTKGVTAMTLSPDGLWLATGSVDGKIRFWDIASRKIEREIQASDWSVAFLNFSPDGADILHGSSSNVSRILRVADGAEIINFGSNITVNGFNLSPDGSVVAMSVFNIENDVILQNAIQLLDVKDGNRLTNLNTIGVEYGLAFSPDGKLLASGGRDGYLRIYGMP